MKVKNQYFKILEYLHFSFNKWPSIHYGYLLFFETTIMGNTADLVMVQKTIIDIIDADALTYRSNGSKRPMRHLGILFTRLCTRWRKTAIPRVPYFIGNDVRKTRPSTPSKIIAHCVSNMSAPVEVVLSADSAGQLFNCAVFDPHSGSEFLSYRGGNTSSKTLTVLSGEYILGAQLGKNFINVWEIQRKVGRATASENKHHWCYTQ